jgi:hypothetical protein
LASFRDDEGKKARSSSSIIAEESRDFQNPKIPLGIAAFAYRGIA